MLEKLTQTQSVYLQMTLQEMVSIVGKWRYNCEIDFNNEATVTLRAKLSSSARQELRPIATRKYFMHCVVWC